MSNTTHSNQLLSPGTPNEPAFKAIIWAFTALAFPFIPVRLFVRLRVFRKIFIDDALVILAYCFLLAYAILWQDRADDLYVVSKVASGLAQPDAYFMNHLGRYLTAVLGYVITYSLCLWSIKLGFLLFFKRLGRNVRYQKIIWWSVLFYTISSFLIWYAVVLWRCIANSPEVLEATCSDRRTVNYIQLSLKLQTAMDITSDIFIILVPISLLWNVQIALRRKLSLYGIFLLTVLVIIASIVRAVVVSGALLSDATWLYLWSAIEMSIAIIVACLASYRALFTPSTTSQRLPVYHAQQNNDSERYQLKRFGLHNIGRSSASSPATDHTFTPLTTFDSASGQTSTYVHAKNPVQQGQSSVNQTDGLSQTALDKSSATPDDGHVHICSEYSVYSETVAPNEIRTGS